MMRGRDEHKYRLIRVLREQGPASRPSLARRLGLNLPNISGLTRELIGLGLITESGYEKSEGGRRAARLALRGEHTYVIGVELSLSAIRGVVMDLGGNIADEQLSVSVFLMGDVGMLYRSLDARYLIVQKFGKDRRPNSHDPRISQTSLFRFY